MKDIIRGYPYPLTLTSARYGGTYSEAQWHAWHARPWQVPQEAYADDTTCMEFWWHTEREILVGKGDSPLQAIDDLKFRIMDQEQQS